MDAQGSERVERGRVSTPTPPRANSRLNYDQSSKAIQQSRPQDVALDVIKDHQRYLTTRLPRIAELIHKAMRPESLIRFVLRDMEGEKGKALRACTPESIYLALLACAMTGLEPGGLKGEAYIVPYKGEATFQRGYKGVIKMALRSRFVKSIRSNVVYEGDVFEVDDGTANTIIHRPDYKGNRGKEIIAAYAIAKLSNGESVHEVMDMEDIRAVRRAGSENSPAWKNWPDQMIRKGPIHRLGKFLQFDERWHVADALDSVETHAEQRAIIDVETNGEVRRTDAQAQSAAEMAAQASSPSEPTDDELLAHEAALNRREGQR
jgi:recombination protein RecT